jgi:hypothetical protein
MSENAHIVREKAIRRANARLAVTNLELEAENQQLRDALEKIVNEKTQTFEELGWFALDTARAALAGTPSEDTA